jgi:DNA repair protein RadC
MSIHEGHRQRMKDRFFYEKMDHFSDHEVLELLLYYAIPRKDTNPIAHALISHFGSLPQVLDASVEELEQVDGISRNAAVLLKLVTEMGRYYEVERKRQTRILKSVEECGNYLLPRFFGRVNETVFLLCLDARCKVLSCREVGEGSINSANVSIRRIVEMALASKASSVVLAHNHPSGIALPSAEDRATTRRVAAALSLVDVVLVDHIIVAENDFVSLAESGFRFDDCVVI